MSRRTVTTPETFNKPSYYNTELLSKITDLSKNTKGKYNQNKSGVQAGTDSIGERAKNTSGESLFSDQNANIAKTGGKQGTINDKDYNTTLRLMREADAYNSMPIGQIFKNGTRNTGGTQSLGYGFEKPALETMETRTMNQAMGLDTARKQAEVQLQAAIDAKDYDAFKAIIQQQLGIELSDYQAKNALDQYALQMALQDVTAKNLQEFTKEYARYFDASTAATIYNMVQSNEPWAMQLAGVLEGQVVPPSNQDQFAADFINGWMTTKESNGELGTPEANMKAYNAALQWLQKEHIAYDVESKAMQKARNNWLTTAAATIRQLDQSLPDATNDPFKTSDNKETK